MLAINDDPVTIEQIELAIIERAYAEGWVVPHPPDRRSGRTVAVVGSGPAGLAVAAELNQCGHSVTVFERDEGPGGLLRFGVPDAKLEKWIIDRRVAILEQEGIEFRLRHRDRHRRHRRGARRALRRRRHRHRQPRLARPRRPRAASWRRSTRRWTTSTSATAGSPPSEGRPSRAPAGGWDPTPDHRGGQEGDRDRRRRHGDGLHLQLPPRGRPQRRHARRLRPVRRRQARSPRAVAAAAQAHRHHVRPGRGRQAALGHRGDRLRRHRAGLGQPRLRAPGDRQLLARPDARAGQRVRPGGRPRAHRHRLPAPRVRGPARAGRHRARPPRQHRDRA